MFSACKPQTGISDAGADASSAQCRSDRECSGGVCDRSAGRCVECVATIDCLAPGQVCARNACIVQVPCSTSRMCPGQVCDPASRVCVDCVGDDDCAADQLCQESYCAPRPRPCASSRECSDRAQVCDPGQGFCVDCLSAVDCDSDEECSANRCVRRSSTPDAGPTEDSSVPAPDASPTDAPPPPTDASSMDAPTPPPDVITPPPDVITPPPDVLTPPPDVITPPPDVLTPTPDVLTPPVGENDRCPGASITSGSPVRVDWTAVRVGADVGTSCGSRMRSGRFRDVVYQFTTTRAGEVRHSLEALPPGSAWELQTDCGVPVMGTCSYRADRVGALAGVLSSVPAGSYRFVIEVPEGAGATTTNLQLTYATGIAPSAWTYTYTTQRSTAFVDVCADPASRRDLPSLDDANVSLTIPFPVQVYDIVAPSTGGTSSMVTLSTNGWLAAGRASGYFVERPVSKPENPDGVIAPYARDLITTARGVCSIALGTAPNRRFVVQWDHARSYSAGSTTASDITVQAIVYEASAGTPNVIEFFLYLLNGSSGPDLMGLRGSYQDNVEVGSRYVPGVVRFTPSRR